MQYKYFYAILNTGILVIVVLMTLSQVKKLNIVNRKTNLSNYYSADGAVIKLESLTLMTLLGVGTEIS